MGLTQSRMRPVDTPGRKASSQSQSTGCPASPDPHPEPKEARR